MIDNRDRSSIWLERFPSRCTILNEPHVAWLGHVASAVGHGSATRHAHDPTGMRHDGDVPNSVTILPLESLSRFLAARPGYNTSGGGWNRLLALFSSDFGFRVTLILAVVYSEFSQSALRQMITPECSIVYA